MLAIPHESLASQLQNGVSFVPIGVVLVELRDVEVDQNFLMHAKDLWGVRSFGTIQYLGRTSTTFWRTNVPFTIVGHLRYMNTIVR